MTNDKASEKNSWGQHLQNTDKYPNYPYIPVFAANTFEFHCLPKIHGISKSIDI